MHGQLDLVEVAEEKAKPLGLSLSVVVSLVVHVALIVWFVTSYRPAPPSASRVPIARYVELIKQNPDQKFVEAPGPKVEQARINAPLSDANRRASMPSPTGERPTTRPGDGSGLYTPQSGAPAARAPQQAQRAQQQQAAQQAAAGSPALSGAPQQASDDTFVYRQSKSATQASMATGPIDWKSAIREVKGSSNGGAEDLDLGRAAGGELGTAEQGPLSFETQWYDWGPYAQSMVSRIRVNWYANMPQLIRTGIKGVVTIRFTIQRDGRITDITTLQTSGHPPYDFAARKAIELSSPLNPLPKDFPNPNERVTAQFYYNQAIPQ